MFKKKIFVVIAEDDKVVFPVILEDLKNADDGQEVATYELKEVGNAKIEASIEHGRKELFNS